MHHQSLFDSKIAAKFELFNSLFLRLPFLQVKKAGTLLPVFSEFCRNQLREGAPPDHIIESFFERVEGIKNQKEIIDNLFSFLRFVERQVVLFDAIEDAAYGEMHDVFGPGSLKDILNHIETNNLETKYEELLRHFNVRVVLTAHPTQFYTPQVLGILDDLVSEFKGNDLARINDLLLQMGKTPFKKKSKPSPIDEAEALIWILENVMYPVIPGLNTEFFRSIDRERGLSQPPVIELGFWPGGDRDGNPFVDAGVTREVAVTLRQKIVSLYLAEVARLKRRLTFEGVYEILLKIEEKLEIAHNPLKEEWLARQAAPGKHKPPGTSSKHTGYQRAGDLVGDLMDLRKELMAKHDGLFLEDLEQFITKVHSFGFYFAILDIRQDSRIHTQTIQALWKTLHPYLPKAAANKPFDKLSGKEETASMGAAISKINKLGKANLGKLREKCLKTLKDPVQRDCLESILSVQFIQEQNGTKACERYIISNFKSAGDLFQVWLLASICGMGKDTFQIDIVPLFESIEDLQQAHLIMSELYDDPRYLEYLKLRQRRQYIMLGFSDGTKDGGYLTANWEILSAKQRLTETSKQYGIEAAFFDGRGGPPARGGGKTHRFYRSLGSKINSHNIHITIQGQTITSNFGTPVSAVHNFQQLATAGIENNLFPSKTAELETDELNLIQSLSDLSLKHYLQLKNHPLFLGYLEELTPLPYYGEANIASRPTRRKSTGKLEFGQLRAIPFVGAWSQMKQNVPGYYGLGTALKALGEAGKLEDLRKLYRNSLFFKTLLDNSMQSMSKTNFGLTQYISRDPKFGTFWKLLHQEARLTEEWLKKVSGHSKLLESDRDNQKSIELREALTLPVAVIQQYALQKIRRLKSNPAGKTRARQIDVMKKMVVKSMAACVNAMRNSV